MAYLTDTAIKALKAPIAGYKVHHDDALSGFGVRVTAKGVKSFVLTLGNDRRRITLGQYPAIGLADARTAAKRILPQKTLGRHFPGRFPLAGALERFVAEKILKKGLP